MAEGDTVLLPQPLAPLVARLSARPEAVEAGSWRRVPVGVGRKAVLELVGDGGRGGGGEVLGRAEVVFSGGGGGEEEQELAELSAGLLARWFGGGGVRMVLSPAAGERADAATDAADVWGAERAALHRAEAEPAR